MFKGLFLVRCFIRFSDVTSFRWSKWDVLNFSFNFLISLSIVSLIVETLEEFLMAMLFINYWLPVICQRVEDRSLFMHCQLCLEMFAAQNNAVYIIIGCIDVL